MFASVTRWSPTCAHRPLVATPGQLLWRTPRRDSVAGHWRHYVDLADE